MRRLWYPLESTGFWEIQCGLALSDIQDQIWLRIHCKGDIKTKSLFPLSPPSSQLWVMKAYEAEYDFRTSQVAKERKETCTGAVTSAATAAGLRPLQGPLLSCSRNTQLCRSPCWPMRDLQGRQLIDLLWFYRRSKREQKFRASLKTTSILSTHFSFFFPV